MAILKEMLAVGAYYIEHGVSNFDSWSKLMIDDFGTNARPFLKNVMEWSIVMAHKKEERLHVKRNCWDFCGCGKQGDGNHGEEPGICPAFLETKLNGIHGGKNGGRACWMVAGTKCGSRIKRIFVPKFIVCKICDFRKTVIHEESQNFVVSDDFMKMLLH